ncbi:MAG: SnoaL-like domain-containing protein [Hamadaea sp.]|uniref:nuclear transport factor 2 family protein n=1 Tax=Hamadaea sp. TaxID=2024425 RepID=UPI001816990B|nr:nuclear transport factor 2 family protein [Hamadaea sp.]NUR72315.1 SnoaL-like domain-containing protein [Hamadaea sp.]NUT18709.1 SnoaL-like domain-containing protein [Hamadaea sp.]
MEELAEQVTPTEVFHRLVHAVCDERWDDAIALYADRTHVSHPFAEDPGPMLSQEELRHHFTPPPGWVSPIRRQPADILVHETADPEVIVAEFAYRGVNVASGQPFAIPCVFVMRVRDGLIVESRDYIDHVRSARARS